MTVEMTYKCIVCGHVHDESVEGAWDSLPDNFECPECGCGKEDYESELWHSV